MEVSGTQAAPVTTRSNPSTTTLTFAVTPRKWRSWRGFWRVWRLTSRTSTSREWRITEKTAIPPFTVSSRYLKQRVSLPWGFRTAAIGVFLVSLMHGTRSYMVSSLLDCISSSRSRKSRKFVAVGSICTYIQYNREELIVKKVCFFLSSSTTKIYGFCVFHDFEISRWKNKKRTRCLPSL